MTLNKVPVNAVPINDAGPQLSLVAAEGVDFQATKTHMDTSAPRQSMDASSTRWNG